MPRIRLASWYDGHAPGDVVEVPGDQVRPLARDGRVAEVLADEPVQAPALPAAVEVPEPPVAEPPAEPPRRRGRKDDST